MATKTITHTPQTETLSSSASGSSVADRKYVPSLSTTWSSGTSETFVEWELGSTNTTATQYLHIIYDNLVAVYA